MKTCDFSGAVHKLPVIPLGSALKVEALIDFHDDADGVNRTAGEQWQVYHVFFSRITSYIIDPKDQYFSPDR